MKTILTFLILFITTFSISFAQYNFSQKEKTAIQTVIQKINTLIEKKWDTFRIKVLTILQTLSKKKNISEKNTAILQFISEWISKKVVEKKSPEKISVWKESFTFIFEDSLYRCKQNPCTTSEDVVKIQGKVQSDLVKNITINDYKLKSYKWSSWEYNPNVAYWNFKNWKNIYTIVYLWEENEVLFTEKFIIHKKKKAPELKKNKKSSSYSVKSTSSLFDENEIRKYWIDLLNDVRQQKQLPLLKYDSSLDSTAKRWSNLAVKRWEINHKVSPWDSYYDYKKKVNWMKQNWVVCKNINRITFSESIAWGEFYCNSKDCTKEVKKTVKGNYNFFMSEKWKAYAPHYKMIVGPYYKNLWLGLSIQNKWKNKYRLYLTAHYCTTNIK